ncbi:hypothetical protein [Saccharothrix lopnurensis]|uniref:Uncharacterized protein n=1 Tax=Saccharothrix lopnurensis TaxID=1670621 RepID=A0ABW1PAJ3_9PSEU
MLKWVRKLGSVLRTSWDERPIFDVVLTIVLVGFHMVLVYRWGVTNYFAQADSQQRLAIYAAGAGMMSLIAGFTGNAIAQYGSSTGDVARVIRHKFGAIIRKNWLSIIRWLLFCALACVFCMVLDSKTSPRAAEWIFQFAVSVAAWKFFRLVFLFRVIISAIDYEGSRPVPSAPQLNLRGDEEGS